MIEPEVAFNDLDANMDLAEDFIKYILKYAIDNCEDDLEFLEDRLLQEEKSKPMAERSEMALREKIQFIIDNNFTSQIFQIAHPSLRGVSSCFGFRKPFVCRCLRNFQLLINTASFCDAELMDLDRSQPKCLFQRAVKQVAFYAAIR